MTVMRLCSRAFLWHTGYYNMLKQLCFVCCTILMNDNLLTIKNLGENQICAYIKELWLHITKQFDIKKLLLNAFQKRQGINILLKSGALKFDSNLGLHVFCRGKMQANTHCTWYLTHSLLLLVHEQIHTMRINVLPVSFWTYSDEGCFVLRDPAHSINLYLLPVKGKADGIIWIIVITLWPHDQSAKDVSSSADMFTFYVNITSANSLILSYIALFRSCFENATKCCVL